MTDQLSRGLRLDKLLRLKVFPIAVSLPWGVAPAALPQFPLPTRIRTRLMPAVDLDHDPDRADDCLEEKYREVQNSIQRGVDALAPSAHYRCSAETADFKDLAVVHCPRG